MQDNTPLPAARVFPQCAGVGLLWLCVSALIVLPLVFSIFFLCTLPSGMAWTELVWEDNPRMPYASRQFAVLCSGFFISLVTYFPWLMVAYGIGLGCSRFWLRALWAVLLVAYGVGLFCSRTAGPAVPVCLVPLLFIYEAVCLLSYLLPYWLLCRRAARR